MHGILLAVYIDGENSHKWIMCIISIHRFLSVMPILITIAITIINARCNVIAQLDKIIGSDMHTQKCFN